jgi:trehalose synthase
VCSALTFPASVSCHKKMTQCRSRAAASVNRRLDVHTGKESNLVLPPGRRRQTEVKLGDTMQLESLGIERYLCSVGAEAVADIFRAARRLYGLRILAINSTFHGGGVAGMLNSLVPLFNDVGINADWNLLYGDPALFHVTKKLHNALQGEKISLSRREMQSYLSVNQAFARYSPISHHNLMIVHDPQPLPMIRYRQKNVPWIWRCHIDISAPDEAIWQRLKPFVLRYDVVVVSSETFRQPDLPVETAIIPPAIDTLSAINRDLSESTIDAELAKYGIPRDKPLIVQVSRFDKWKDPTGVVKVFQRVKQELDCRLIMLGNMASDDPEGPMIFKQVASLASQMKDVHLITETDPLLVNALQREAAVVMQLSSKEGFGLTVSEALWKGTPVVATRVGGIPLQVIDGQTGYLVEPGDYDTAAERVIRLLKDESLRTDLGARGRVHVQENFLMPRLLLDWLKLIDKVTRT